MPSRIPPRREPRVLALARSPTGLLWAVADPWELRGIGELRCTGRSVRTTARRLARREKPTAIVAQDAALAGLLRRGARAIRIPLLAVPRSLPPFALAAELYPEVTLFAPRRDFHRVAALAIATVLHSPITIRRYAPRRHRDTPRPA